MKVLRYLAMAALALALVVAPRRVAAQVEIELIPFTGGTFFLADPPSRFAIDRETGSPVIVENGGFEDAFTLGLTGAVRFENGFAIEGMFSWVPTSLDATAGLSQPVDARSFMYGAALVYHVPLETWLRPFMGLGFGGETFSYEPEGWQGHTDWMGQMLGGLELPIGDRLALRLEARDCLTFFESHVANVDDEVQNDLMVTAGLSFGFPLDR